MKRTLWQTIAAIAFLSTAATAGAAEFWTYVPGNGQLKVNNAGGGAGFAPVAVTGYSGSGAAGGQFNGNFWNGDSMPADSFFRFFCIELTQYANAGPNPYLSSSVSDDQLRKLYDVAYPNKASGDFWNGAQTNFGVFGDATSAAAFQVAVWNIYFDTDLSLSGGSFEWTGVGPNAVKDAAQALLTQVDNYSGDGYTRWTLYKFDSERYQNYLTATYRVPEPATLGLLATALIGLGATLRRRSRG